MERPPLLGLWHVALNVPDVATATAFYRDLLGMKEEWSPDPDNVYLTSGRDNLALHRSEANSLGAPGALDHVGFVLPNREAVDAWAGYLEEKGHPVEVAPKLHRDGAYSFYTRDPSGNKLQFIHHPPLAPTQEVT